VKSAVVWSGVLIALALGAMIPARTGDIQSHPRPARSYTDAVDRARAGIAADDSVVARGGATILLAHGSSRPRADVLIHGFTDSPRQFAALAESLYASGDNVYVPRLPHHAERGRNVAELGRLTAVELARTTDAAVDIAAGLGDSVMLLGLSVGGTLAVWAAEHRPEVRRVVVIAPPFEITHIPSLLERPVFNLASRMPNLSFGAALDSARPDRYPGVATRGLAQILVLGVAVRRDADRLAPGAAEAAFLVNAHDHTVKEAAVLDVARVWTRRGVPVMVYEFPHPLELPHNIIDPAQPVALAERVYPILQALLHGERPQSLVVVRW
jgi:alpha-beta hydrolase superfamily lysophospholipase